MHPPHGFRHAATLLISRSARAIPLDVSPAMMRLSLERLAMELVALAGDMRAPAGAAEWLTGEFNSTIDRLPQQFDRAAAKSAGDALFSGLTHKADIDARDLFLIYVPEDRLPVAAPLAIELTKRRVSVAFADYEVATASELTSAVTRGSALHRRGAVLHTAAFERTGWTLPATTDRLRIIHDADRFSADGLAAWACSGASEK